MIISRKIISQWLDISNIKDQAIIHALNSLGFEVEQVKNLVFSNTNLIVGQIVKITNHPKSNKLNICEVNIGNKYLTIVCGASNVQVTNKVVVAMVNSKLANGLTITTRTIQDVVSSGMICSLSELGIASYVQNKEELSGIINLPTTAVVGNTNPLQYLNLDDTIFTIDLTINRSDCLGMYNIARELAAFFKLPLQKMSISNLSKLDSKAQVNVANEQIMALATLKIDFKTPTIKTTPINMRRILQLLNIAPKTLVEDIANLVMLELGQPLVMFNGDILKAPCINISPKTYPQGSLKITTGDILLHDKYLAFSVLGINTNNEYEVKQSTKSVYIFSINPDVPTMMKQFKRHNVPLTTTLERLIKPVKPDYYLIALQRYLFILDELKVDYDISGFSCDTLYEIKTTVISLDFNVINNILGTNLDIDQVINYLTTIGCQIEPDADKMLKVIVPNHRSDLNNTHDLSEEIARIIGYDNLEAVMPRFYLPTVPVTTITKLMVSWKQHLLSYGFNEVKTYSLTAKENLVKFNFFNYQIPIILSSPLVSTRAAMRFNLTHSLLNICQFNAARKEKQLKLFTSETIYTGDDNDDAIHLAFMIMGQFWPKSSINKINIEPYYLVKGFVEHFLKKVIINGANNIIYKPKLDDELLHPYLSVDIFYEQQHLGVMGALHPQTEKLMEVENIFLVEINCTKLAAIIDNSQLEMVKFKPWSKFNALSRDVSVIINNKMQFLDIKNAILAKKIDYLEDITLIDFYLDETLKARFQHSLTLNFKFNCVIEQLDEKKVSDLILQIQNVLKEKFKAIIR